MKTQLTDLFPAMSPRAEFNIKRTIKIAIPVIAFLIFWIWLPFFSVGLFMP